MLSMCLPCRERGVHALGDVTLSCLCMLCLLQATRNSALSVEVQWERRKDASSGQRRTTSNACVAASAVSPPPLFILCSFTPFCSPILPFFSVHSSFPFHSYQSPPLSALLRFSLPLSSTLSSYSLAPYYFLLHSHFFLSTLLSPSCCHLTHILTHTHTHTMYCLTSCHQRAMLSQPYLPSCDNCNTSPEWV